MKKTLYLLLALFLLLSCVGCTPPEAASTEQTQEKTEPAAPSSTESDPPVSSQIASPSSSETEAPASTAAQTPAASSKEEASPAASTAAKPAAQTQAKPPVTTKAKAPAQTQVKPPVTTKASTPVATTSLSAPPVNLVIEMNSFEDYSQFKQLLSKDNKELEAYLKENFEELWWWGKLKNREDLETLVNKLESAELITLKQQSGYRLDNVRYSFDSDTLVYNYMTEKDREWISFYYYFSRDSLTYGEDFPTVATMKVMGKEVKFFESTAKTLQGNLNSVPIPVCIALRNEDGSLMIPQAIRDNLEITPMKDLLNGKK